MWYYRVGNKFMEKDGKIRQRGWLWITVKYSHEFKDHLSNLN